MILKFFVILMGVYVMGYFLYFHRSRSRLKEKKSPIKESKAHDGDAEENFSPHRVGKRRTSASMETEHLL